MKKEYLLLFIKKKAFEFYILIPKIKSKKSNTKK